MERWAGRVAVVTGASEGIGEAVVRCLAANGMKVVALARRKELLEKLENRVNTSSNKSVWGHVCDVSLKHQVAESFKWVEDNVGAVSVLVNNAACLKYLPLVEMDIEGMKTTMDTNLMGIFYCTQAALSSMKKYGIHDGHIVNLNSILGHRDLMKTGLSPYTAAKHALTSISESLRRELVEAGSKTRVTCISPGFVDTTMVAWYIKDHPEITMLTAEDVAQAVLYAISTPPHVNISEVIIESL